MSNKLERIHRVVGGKVHLSDEDSALISSLFEGAVKEARAEVLAACMADVDVALAIYMEDKGRSKDEKALIGGVCLGIKFRLEQLQPAASGLEALLLQASERETLPKLISDALEELLEQAHEAALPRAAEQLLKSLTEGGEFAAGSPLAKVKRQVEELLRKSRLEEAKLRPHQDGCAALLTGAKVDDCDDWCGRNKRITKLEKARAIPEEKP